MTHLLQHKSWHVSNRKNIERVERDEQIHREQQKLIEEKKRMATGEHTLAIMRQRAIEKGLILNNQSIDDEIGEQCVPNEQSINLFSDFSDEALGITSRNISTSSNSSRERREKKKPSHGISFKDAFTKDEVNRRTGAIVKPRFHNIVTTHSTRSIVHDEPKQQIQKKDQTSNKKQKKSIEQLRAERLKREELERQRSQTLLK
jgi:hypothetical protein